MAGTIMSGTGWIFVPPGAGYLAALPVMWGGIVWTGLFMARVNVEMRFSDRSGRSTYVAAVNVILAVAGAAGGITGGCIALLARHLHVEIGPLVFLNYHLTFLVSGCIRALSILWMVGMTDPGSKPVGQVARQMAAELYQNAPMMLFLPVRLLGRPFRLLRPASRRTNEGRRGGDGVEQVP